MRVQQTITLASHDACQSFDRREIDAARHGRVVERGVGRLPHRGELPCLQAREAGLVAEVGQLLAQQVLYPLRSGVMLAVDDVQDRDRGGLFRFLSQQKWDCPLFPNFDRVARGSGRWHNHGDIARYGSRVLYSRHARCCSVRSSSTRPTKDL